MLDRVTVLETIDRAFDERRTCAACGAPTILRTDRDAVILECSEREGAGLMARIDHLLTAHTQRIVIDLSEGIAA